MRGELAHFTGVSDPYEEPLEAEIVIETDLETPEHSAARIIARLEELGLVESDQASGYSEEDEEEVRRRLEALGYV